MPRDQYYWEYSFDLFDSELKKYYGKKSYKRGWGEIGEFLIDNEFDNIDDKQGSCYFTSKMMSPQRANTVIRKMFKALPWVTLCLNKDALTIRQDNVFSNKDYADRLNNTKVHMNRLLEYYKKLNVDKQIIFPI